MTENQAIEDISMDLELALDYRNERAEWFPDDDRNSEAVRLIGILLEQAPQLSGTPTLRSYIQTREVSLWPDLSDESKDYDLAVAEAWSRYNSRIAFDHWPDNIVEFVEGLVAIAAEQSKHVASLR